MKLIDIGVNLTNKRFEGDLAEVVARAQLAGVKHQVVTGTSVQASEAAYQMAAKSSGYLSATAGVHPHDAKTWDAQSASLIEALLEKPEVVAVGECGLDFNRDFSPRDQQLSCFEAQLQLATQVNKVVFLHQRDAHEALIERLSEYRPQLSGAVVHCFTGSREEMEAYIELDCYIGITGWLCDERRGQELRDLVKYIPLNRLLIETDAPYLMPRNIKPRPKSSRNEPAFLPVVLNTLAEIIEQPAEALAQTTFDNSTRFFQLSTT
ncbi:MAG: hydrolase TatD [Alteromonadaceae bacterium]|nr:MAG: hydrolase TatD [Alteromonadaceae bacterium]